MKLWKDMSHAEREGLKAAHHRGWTIQFFSHVWDRWEDCTETLGPTWQWDYAYRVKLETKEETMKLWKDMTACEKGALLLAYHHEGKTIEYRHQGADSWLGSHKVGLGVTGLGWHDNYYYRVKSVPVVTEVVRYGHTSEYPDHCGGFIHSYIKGSADTHKITFNLVDGVPDCLSIKMIKL